MIRTEQQPIYHCMVVHNYYPFAETRVQRQAEALIDYGFNVDIICLRYGDEPPVEKGGRGNIYRLPLKRHKKRGPLFQLFEYLTFLILAGAKLTKLHLQHRYQIVQIHNLPDFLVFAAIFPRLTGSRIILDLHDLMPEFYCAKFKATMNSWPVRLIRWQERLSCRFAHHVITVTESWRQTLIERGVPATLCTVVMNVADPHYFSQTDSVEPSRQNGYFRLIYHGTITQRYGVDLIVQALAQLHRDIPNMELLIRGRGEYFERLVLLTDELNLDSLVDINADFLPISELTNLIRSAHLAIVPYRRDIFTDGILPTKLMEYAALGIPAVVSRTPGIAAYFDETMVKFFTAEDVGELAGCIKTLYYDRAKLSMFAQNIQSFNRHYNW